ncbi:MAG: FAD:protein FMN transferase [Lachnospiraceae bacterium]|nr:FAD:protein FMN transferase [Lachnospiraceae bacterium]
MLLCAAACFFCGCAGGRASSGTVLTRTGFFFNTIVEVTIFDKRADAALLDGCMELCNRYEALLSAHVEGSDIDRINRAQGEEVAVDRETAELLSCALSFTEETQGAFDVTIGAVSAMWNFTGDPPGPVPEADEIAQALTHVGAGGCIVRFGDGQEAGARDAGTQAQAEGASAGGGCSVQLADPAMQLDPGAVAKGYIADRLKEYLVEHGVQSALINLGGNVLAIGGKEDGGAFNVGIRDPFGGVADYAAVAAVTDKSVVTSGNYERFFEEDGVRYHHILDARTGYPSDRGVAGVTVITDTSLAGDILSTVLFLTGPEEGLALAELLPDTEALFITTEGEILMTENFPLR